MRFFSFNDTPALESSCSTLLMKSSWFRRTRRNDNTFKVDEAEISFDSWKLDIHCTGNCASHVFQIKLYSKIFCTCQGKIWSFVPVSLVDRSLLMSKAAIPRQEHLKAAYKDETHVSLWHETHVFNSYGVLSCMGDTKLQWIGLFR